MNVHIKRSQQQQIITREYQFIFWIQYFKSTMFLYIHLALSVLAVHLSWAKPFASLEPKSIEYGILEKLITLEKENTNLLERIGQLERQIKKPTVISTHVGLSKTVSITGSTRLKYDVEIANIGEAFDLTMGEFTVPVTGIYLIHVQLCLGQSSQWMDLNIMKDGAVIGRVFSGDKSYHSCGTELLNVRLKQGEKVWVQREAGSATTINQDHGWNSFKAVLMVEE